MSDDESPYRPPSTREVAPAEKQVRRYLGLQIHLGIHLLGLTYVVFRSPIIPTFPLFLLGLLLAAFLFLRFRWPAAGLLFALLGSAPQAFQSLLVVLHAIEGPLGGLLVSGVVVAVLSGLFLHSLILFTQRLLDPDPRQRG
ncbi:MAG: hypothetical protein AAF191_01385 [Verrucomicrobiota bacterium]